MALISNPVSEVTAPLARVEAALTQLSADLGTLDVLPGVEKAVGKTNDRLERVEHEVALTRAASEQMAETLEAIRVELAEAARLMAAGVVAGAASSGDKSPAVATVPRAVRARKRA